MFVTPAEYARRRGVTRQAVYNAVKRGVIAVQADGTIDVEAADMAWPPRLNGPIGQPVQPLKVVAGGKAAGKQASAVSQALQSSRALHEAYRARMTRLEFEKASGTVVPVEEARQAAFNTGRRARDLLAALPDRLASSLAMRTAEEVHALLQTEIRHIVDEVGRWARL